jgi:CxxC-x17-CxxC domain-containing protein
MFRTTCDECGNSCEVPFKPTMGKPVYCRECFDTTGPNPDRAGAGRTGAKKDYKSKGPKSGGYTNSRSSDDGSGAHTGNSGTVSTAQFDKLNDKLDKILKLLSEKDE